MILNYFCFEFGSLGFEICFGQFYKIRRASNFEFGNS